MHFCLSQDETGQIWHSVQNFCIIDFEKISFKEQVTPPHSNHFMQDFVPVNATNKTGDI
jgi:hypothetical protein